jgi:hypothetical protein
MKNIIFNRIRVTKIRITKIDFYISLISKMSKYPRSPTFQHCLRKILKFSISNIHIKNKTEKSTNTRKLEVSFDNCRKFSLLFNKYDCLTSIRVSGIPNSIITADDVLYVQNNKILHIKKSKGLLAELLEEIEQSEKNYWRVVDKLKKRF